jgi:SAM-dependent methyltransferase
MEGSVGISWLRTYAEQCVALWREWSFDRKYRVSTRGRISTDRLQLRGPNAAQAIQYVPTHPKAARLMLEALPIQDFSQYTFIDLGSGKGRMLFRAAEYPFKRIVGVELSPELNEMARANIASYTNPRQRCTDITSVNQDAGSFVVPDEPLVVYLFFPFRQSVMEQVLSNVAQSLQRAPRDVLIAYMNPELAHLIDSHPSFQRISRGTFFIIYRSTAGNVG